MKTKPDAKICMKVWREIDKPSLAKLARELERRGYINPQTGKGYSRWWLRVLMRTTLEGSIMLGDPPSARSLAYDRRKPLIVEDRPQYLKWYREHGFLGFPIMPVSKVTVADVKLRFVYGDLPISLARHARSVFLPDLDNEECPVLELKTKPVI